MDWNSRRITAILANALEEDRATRDATSYACIEPGQRGIGTVIAKQDCILCGVGAIRRILEIFAELDGTIVNYPQVTTHNEIFDGVRLHTRQQKPWGSERFQRQVEALTQRATAVRPRGCPRTSENEPDPFSPEVRPRGRPARSREK